MAALTDEQIISLTDTPGRRAMADVARQSLYNSMRMPRGAEMDEEPAESPDDAASSEAPLPESPEIMPIKAWLAKNAPWVLKTPLLSPNLQSQIARDYSQYVEQTHAMGQDEWRRAEMTERRKERNEARQERRMDRREAREDRLANRIYKPSDILEQEAALEMMTGRPGTASKALEQYRSLGKVAGGSTPRRMLEEMVMEAGMKQGKKPAEILAELRGVSGGDVGIMSADEVSKNMAGEYLAPGQTTPGLLTEARQNPLKWGELYDWWGENQQLVDPKRRAKIEKIINDTKPTLKQLRSAYREGLFTQPSFWSSGATEEAQARQRLQDFIQRYYTSDEQESMAHDLAGS